MTVKLPGRELLLTPREFLALAPLLYPPDSPGLLVRAKPILVIGDGVVAFLAGLYLAIEGSDKDVRGVGVSLVTAALGLFAGIKAGS